MAHLIPPSRRLEYEQRAFKCLLKQLRYLSAIRRIERIPRWWWSGRARRLMKHYDSKQAEWGQAKSLWLRQWEITE